MKPQRFEIGQAVTPKVSFPWNNSANIPPPKPEIYHVLEYHDGTKYTCVGGYAGHWYINVSERPYHWLALEDGFEAVISDHELASLLSTVEESVTTKV